MKLRSAFVAVQEGFKVEDAEPILSYSDRLQPLIERYQKKYDAAYEEYLQIFTVKLLWNHVS